MNQIVKKIYDYSLEDILGERFGRYSKSIIQDRALPDVRDGLKPVQRRIMYSMYRNKNTYDKPYQKSARGVGDVMGKYHPHGDSSIYEAMVRMSQWWKQSTPFIDMHGNNGSLDGDNPAAMRYTEARLNKIAVELLKDIDKDTVLWAPNYDDSLNEPTVLPIPYPNLLVNGSTGISAGYATNIPPHNLSEVIDATIKRIDSPNCSIDSILNVIKGPDFPTGGTVYGEEGIKNAFTTGRGKVILEAKYQVEKNKQIIIEEIPFEVNKANLVKKIDEIRYDKKIDGISEVRDESDLKSPMRIVIDIKKEANIDLVINYLLKNTEMQISFNYNMVAIVNKRPVTIGLIDILDAYIKHQKEVILYRTHFDLNFAQAQIHIVEGLIKAISIIDQIIKIIRKSKDKGDAKLNLQTTYQFTEKQADAIVSLQLYRLTNTDVVALEERKNNLMMIIEGLQKIINDEQVLKSLMKNELRKIKNEYGYPRRSIIKSEVSSIKIEKEEMINHEDVIVMLTNDGYLKRVSKKSYNLSNKEKSELKSGDYLMILDNANTLDVLLVFTDLGNYLYLPVYQIPEMKWSELGRHISSIVKLGENEKIINGHIFNQFNGDDLVFVTKNGMIKRSQIKDFQVMRNSKLITAIKLKNDDKLVSVYNNKQNDVVIITQNGFYLCFTIDQVPIVGLKTAGVKAISLKNDQVKVACSTEKEFLLLATDKKTLKRIKTEQLKKMNRARKGSRLIRDVITNPYLIIDGLMVDSKDLVGIKYQEQIEIVSASEVPITDFQATGKNMISQNVKKLFKVIDELS